MARVRVVFLGTGAADNAERRQAAILVEAGATCVLLDAGSGPQIIDALLSAGFGPPALEHIFLSHPHLDHVGGLPFLLEQATTWPRDSRNATSQICVYATEPTVTSVRERVLGENENRRDTPGRAEWYLLQGRQTVQLADGLSLTMVPVDHFPDGGAAGCLVTYRGRTLAYSGDTLPCPALAGAAADAELLIHEAGGLLAQAQEVHRLRHSTAADAGQIAALARVKTLALTHLPSAHRASVSALVEEARRFAPGVEVSAASDGMIICFA